MKASERKAAKQLADQERRDAAIAATTEKGLLYALWEEAKEQTDLLAIQVKVLRSINDIAVIWLALIVLAGAAVAIYAFVVAR